MCVVLTMLANEKEPSIARYVGPEPALAAVVSRANLLGALRHAPERDGHHLTATGPPPQRRVLLVPDRAHPVLAGRVAPS